MHEQADLDCHRHQIKSTEGAPFAEVRTKKAASNSGGGNLT